jgi:hypothetical protein
VSKIGRKSMLSMGYGSTWSARKPRSFNALGGN